MKQFIVGCLVMAVVVGLSCQKEESFELGNTPSAGSLQSEASGDCLPKAVNGTYVAAVPLVPATNTLAVTVDVTKIGVYTIYTDTINGYYFRGTGTFVKTGVTTITLRSNGTPFTAGINNFVVTYEGTSCDIAVTVLATSPLPPAVFTLDCAGAVIGGSYATSNPLNFTNTVKLNVNVSTIGTYTLSATKNGMTFAKTGTFTATGAQTVTLEGTGTPTVNGNNDVPITVGTATCNFTIPVGTPSIGTLGTAAAACTPATINGTYTLGTPMVSSANTVQVQVNVTTAGVFSISTNTVAGISFAASGTLGTGSTLVTLNGTGTPTASGVQTFTVTYGANTCTFTIPIGGPAVAVYTPNCGTATKNGTYQVGTTLTAANTITIPVNTTTAGTYAISIPSTNGMLFTGSGNLAAGLGNIVLTGSGTPSALAAPTTNIAIPGSPGCNVAITVTAAAAPAVYTPNCAGAIPAGTYKVGTALTAANTITIPVNTTTAGAYSISITINGMLFTGIGNLTAGPGNILLTGSGTPTVAATPTTNIAIPGSPGCNVALAVAAATGGSTAYVPDCSSADVLGLYEATTQLNVSNVIDIDVNVTVAGPYSFTIPAVNGMTFTASGTFASTGPATIRLIGSGTPANGGSFGITVPGTTPCTFQLVVDPAPTIDWKFNVTNPTPAISYQGQTDAADLQSNMGLLIFAIAGSNSDGSDEFIMGFSDANTINAGETYSSTTGAVFSYAPVTVSGTQSTDPFVASPSTAGVSVTFTVTSHNTTTKTITGTFTGTAKNTAGQIITFSGGTFRGTYP